MKPRTKISLIIAMLIAAAGLFHAATPTFFTSAPLPTGVAASPGKMYVTEYCQPRIDTISDTGAVNSFATLPGNPGECKERYLAISPGFGTWAPNDIYVTDGGVIYKVSPDGLGVTQFATLTGCGYDHSGITFDHVGTFGFDMIVTCGSGDIWRVDSTTASFHVANLGFGEAEYEGPVVAPLSFGPLGGQILVADEDGDAVHAIKNDSTVTPSVFTHIGAESVVVIPLSPCGFGNSDAILVSALQQQGSIVKLSTSAFTGFGGDILIMSEEGAGILREHWNGSSYEQSVFDATSFPYEGSAFVDCQGPTPTPTATALPMATPTSTPTPTPTVTPTSLTVSPASSTYGGSASLFATLTKTSDSSVVSGKSISFTLNGNFAGSAVTNSSGIATLTVNSLCGSVYNAGNYPTGVAASFGGDSSSAASSGTNSLTISKATATVTVTPYNVTYDNQPHTATVGTITGVCGETGSTVGTVDVTGTTHTLPGDYPSDPWTFAGTANYNNNSGTVHNSIRYGTCIGSDPGGVILPPINNDGSSVYKRQGGSTIPVKFMVCDASGNFISDPNAVFSNGCCGSITMLTRMRGTVDDVNAMGVTDIPDVAFHQVGNHWQFNLVTTNLQAGYTYTFEIPLRYGSIQFTVAVK